MFSVSWVFNERNFWSSLQFEHWPLNNHTTKQVPIWKCAAENIKYLLINAGFRLRDNIWYLKLTRVPISFPSINVRFTGNFWNKETLTYPGYTYNDNPLKTSYFNLPLTPIWVEYCSIISSSLRIMALYKLHKDNLSFGSTYSYKPWSRSTSWAFPSSPFRTKTGIKKRKHWNETHLPELSGDKSIFLKRKWYRSDIDTK